MWEKLVLAVILTFSCNVFAQLSLSSPSQSVEKISSQKQEVLALIQPRK